MSAAGAAPMPAPYPAAGAAPAPDDDSAGPDAEDASDQVVCTITSNGDGSFTVYAGDEPDAGGAGPDAAASPDASAAGKQCPTVGAALKATMDVLKEAESASGGDAGSSSDQFNAGFEGGSSASPPKQKY